MSLDAMPPTSDVLTLRPRPRPTSALSAVLTLGWRAMLKIKHVPFQLFDVTITPIMFTLLFTYMFGGALAGSPEVYIQFLLPGILVQTILFITVYTGVGVCTDIQKGLFDRFRSLPMWQPAPIRPAAGLIGVLLAFALVLLFSFAISWIWIIFSMKVKTPESVMTTSFLFLMPLTFASNIFVEISTMPSWLQAVVRHNPVTHLTHASRGLMHGTPVTADILWVLVAAAVITGIAAPVAMRMYHQER
jgi:ABC-2 type transport system permease protein